MRRRRPGSQGEPAGQVAQGRAELAEQRRNRPRNARLEPLADQAREIWSKLRAGEQRRPRRVPAVRTATRRALELDVTIDGTPGSALGTMSQGEINALALSIFLPGGLWRRQPVPVPDHR